MDYSAQTDAGQHWEDRNSSKSSLSLVARFGKHQLCCSPMQGTSTTGCCHEEIPCSLPVSLFPSKAACYSFWIRMGFFKFPQWHRDSRIIAGLLLISAAPGWCLLDVLPSPAPCTKHCLDSAPVPFPPYGLSSHPHHPCSEAFPMAAFREMQPPSLPPSLPALLHRHSPLFGDTACFLGWC